MIYSNEYNDNEKEILQKLIEATKNDFNFSAKSISVNDLKEMMEWVQDRWDTEWLISELHGTTPPENWLRESREIILQITTELAARKSPILN